MAVDFFKLADFFEIAEGRSRRSRTPLLRAGAASQGLRGPGGDGGARFRVTSERIAALLRVARGAPEVVVKVTGSNGGRSGVADHLAYLAREPEAEAELSDGQVLVGRQAIVAAADLFLPDEFVTTNTRSSDAAAVHVTFSMPPGTATKESLMGAVRATSKRVFSGHEYLLVLHTDKSHLHVHAVVAARDGDGRKLRRYKPHVHEWRREFALQLRKRGVLAEATSRSVRGVTRKPASRVLHVLRANRRAGGLVRVWTDEQKILEALREIGDQERVAMRTPRPWETAVPANRKRVEEGWLHFDRYLRSLAVDDDSVRAARDVREFRTRLPPVEFERDRLLKVATSELAQVQGQVPSRRRN